MSIEPILDVFPFGSPSFGRLVNELRLRVFEEAVISDLPDLVFTMIWGVDLADDPAIFESSINAVEGRVSFVELYADQAGRLARNVMESRLDHKRSKRDLEFSRGNLLHLDNRHVLNTGADRTLAEDLLDQHRYLRIDNTHRSPADVAGQVVAELF